MVLTQHYLKEVLEYNPECGIFTWRKVLYNHIHLLNTVAGSIYANGYRYVQIGGKDYRAGRLAWFYVHGEWPAAYVDHINGNRADDRIENLRLATNSQNQANRGVMATNTSGTKGVRYEASRRRWRAQITANGKSKCLGRFRSRDEAMQAYAKAAKEIWGDFARL